jgi:glutathione peroxidase
MHVRRTVRLAVLVACLLPTVTSRAEDKKMSPLYTLKMDSLAGKPVEFKQYQGKVLLIVNVASECGYTPQYKGLQALHQQYSAKGLAVLGVPSNDFGQQEPGTNAQIATFCKKNYGVEFDLLAKTGVVGKGQCVLYQHLTSKEANATLAGPVKWNFEKFLVGRTGAVVARFAADVEPDDPALVKALEAELSKK